VTDHPPLDPALFAEPPARDDRFDVKERWTECANFPDGHPEKVLEFLHRQLNEEANVLENAARNLADFPDVEWPLRMWLARQCADEARHVETYRRFFEDRGGRVGQYPVMNFQYRILGRIPSLLGRLAVQNRTFEADGLDAAVFAVAEARREGDHELAEMYDTQQADEVLHVRFANEWIRREIRREPRNALELARAIDQGSRAFQQIFAGGGTGVTKYGVAPEARLEAGFDEAEVAVAARLAEERRAAARRQTVG
jgi:uncharacterized ferritin-like protein (DUF455 family)